MGNFVFIFAFFEFNAFHNQKVIKKMIYQRVVPFLFWHYRISDNADNETENSFFLAQIIVASMAVPK